MNIPNRSQGTKQIKFESIPNPVGEAKATTIFKKALRWITVGDDRHVLLGQKDTQLTVQDLKNFAAGIGLKNSKKEEYIKEFLKEAYPEVFENAADEKRFCKWLVELGDVEVAFKIVREVSTDSEAELLESIQTLKGRGYQKELIVDIVNKGAQRKEIAPLLNGIIKLREKFPEIIQEQLKNIFKENDPVEVISLFLERPECFEAFKILVEEYPSTFDFLEARYLFGAALSMRA